MIPRCLGIRFVDMLRTGSLVIAEQMLSHTAVIAVVLSSRTGSSLVCRSSLLVRLVDMLRIQVLASDPVGYCQTSESAVDFVRSHASARQSSLEHWQLQVR